jgi:hypothetical protein
MQNILETGDFGLFLWRIGVPKPLLSKQKRKVIAFYAYVVRKRNIIPQQYLCLVRLNVFVTTCNMRNDFMPLFPRSTDSFRLDVQTFEPITIPESVPFIKS